MYHLFNIHATKKATDKKISNYLEISKGAGS